MSCKRDRGARFYQTANFCQVAVESLRKGLQPLDKSEIRVMRKDKVTVNFSDGSLKLDLGFSPAERIDDHEDDLLERSWRRLAAILISLRSSMPSDEWLVGEKACRKYNEGYGYQDIGNDQQGR